jgi:hypothetical protein
MLGEGETEGGGRKGKACSVVSCDHRPDIKMDNAFVPNRRTEKGSCRGKANEGKANEKATNFQHLKRRHAAHTTPDINYKSK